MAKKSKKEAREERIEKEGILSKREIKAEEKEEEIDLEQRKRDEDIVTKTH